MILTILERSLSPFNLDDDLKQFIDAIFFKQALSAKIHERVSYGVTTKSKILNVFKESTFPLGITKDVISFDISEEYRSGVVDDLHKHDIIKGRDGRIKSY
ncbi:MAG TPA: hypothetical protein O0Y05_02000 [Methanocorpusculum sp.]|nr:hypothetical protein [Methanocorpusculum sp.]